jgi:hypothetical protein
MAPVFVYLRMRVYTAWMLSETCCIVCGLGAYREETQPRVGHGPTVNEGEEKYGFVVHCVLGGTVIML